MFNGVEETLDDSQDRFVNKGIDISLINETIMQTPSFDSTDEALTSQCRYLTTGEYNQSSHLAQCSCSFSTLCLNIRSLNYKSNLAHLQFLIFSLNKKPDIISVTETWLNANSYKTYITLQGYTCLTNSRVGSRGGGVAMYVNEDIAFVLQPELSIMKDKLFESLYILWIPCIIILCFLLFSDINTS